MKLYPIGDVAGLVLPGALNADRASLHAAVRAHDYGALGRHFRAWRELVVHLENDPSATIERDGYPVFVWSAGSSRSVRYETACLAYACARAFFHSRQYALAFKYFGLALEETMQCRAALPLTSDACGAFRLRCLVRAQRLGICEIRSTDARAILSRAIWLAYASREYSKFPGAEKKEPLTAGESLVATACAIITGRPEPIKASAIWAQNPFGARLAEIATSARGSDRYREPSARSGAFDWERFTSSRTFAA